MIINVLKRKKNTTIGASATPTSFTYSGTASINRAIMSLECSISGISTGTYAPSVGNMRPRISTEIIGPMEQSATRPKLSLLACLSLLIEETPTPRAMMKGTVIGPVVTPPESNAMAQKSFGTNIASPKTII